MSLCIILPLVFMLASLATCNSVIVPAGPFPNAEVILGASNRSIGARQAAFGPRLPIPPRVNDTFPHNKTTHHPSFPLFDLVAGRLVPLIHADPDNHHGCLPVPPSMVSHWPPSVGPPQPLSLGFNSMFYPHNSVLQVDPWVALVQRGGCSFVDKVMNMQRSGAVAVIVGDDDSSVGDALITMYAGGDVARIRIPSVFISYNEYVRVVSDIRSFKTDVWLMGNGNLAQDQWTIMDMILAAVVAPLILLVGVYALCRACIRSANTLNDLGDSQIPATSAKILSSLPKKTFYSAKAKEVDALTCVVCLDEFEDECELLELPCGHHFHPECITVWLRDRKNVCPICRFELVDEEDDVSCLEGVNLEDMHSNSLASLPLAIPEPHDQVPGAVLINMEGGLRGGAASAPPNLPIQSSAPTTSHVRSPQLATDDPATLIDMDVGPSTDPSLLRRSLSTCSSPPQVVHEFRIESHPEQSSLRSCSSSVLSPWVDEFDDVSSDDSHGTLDSDNTPLLELVRSRQLR